MFHSTGLIASGSRDGSIKLWRDAGGAAELGGGGWGTDKAAGGAVGHMRGHDLTVNALAASGVRTRYNVGPEISNFRCVGTRMSEFSSLTSGR